MLCFPKAKINLGLQVLRKRADGYHDIETVMVPVPLHDALEVTDTASRTDIRTFGTDFYIPVEQNLVYKAWKLMADRHGIKPVLFHLAKRIPSGAGLGGGSSNAAVALVLLNNFFRLELPIDVLKTYAAELGSDCAFFIDSKPALAQGRGEVLKSIELDLSAYTIAIVKSLKMSDGQTGVSTPVAYSLVKPDAERIPESEIISLPVSEWRNKLINDFEKPISEKYPEISEIISKLYAAGAVYAAMSGSGSACFGLFETKNTALNFSRDFFVHIAKMQ
ncbi:MAG: 4-(cytidine 5'-diphospho)-2-C-methyl-D-erythritol kinase [Bacteroidetes bacterium GWF2_43_63]|nr:MAG: 4-(cytidine 5'-diphospho)-2-C-methyl-D-erythritol kinase [Bacteroidetes bacterium GWE2_42_42]OFY52551.1 MAG: 4-(cytidine 5'-diphospho)-2-C-methyl-D-erythritol kinase [Bacteroidetes bacterium GWF2_43_63]HBG71459.1 4-(cytidine 5'-diphospho)-2-C-methyl-D-erythritol kinase [Bacteroidales bacterium]HCB60789.1 4-(cytidine 5'-diphospho)-2-C-methyl-D-erythritol kinase [Bacteroidales bacterium]HCY23486.1 4-(cytidine 5'-diphospho)-2-C-methyl-D-erythritol kinase [Bacteroidales bacterium]